MAHCRRRSSTARKTPGQTSTARSSSKCRTAYTETNHGIIDYLVVTSTEWWDGLPAGIRNQLSTIMTEVTVARNKAAFAVNEANKKKIMESGGKIRSLDAAQRKAWVDAMKPVWSKFEGDIGGDMIKAAQAANAGS